MEFGEFGMRETTGGDEWGRNNDQSSHEAGAFDQMGPEPTVLSVDTSSALGHVPEWPSDTELSSSDVSESHNAPVEQRESERFSDIPRRSADMAAAAKCAEKPRLVGGLVLKGDVVGRPDCANAEERIRTELARQQSRIFPGQTYPNKRYQSTLTLADEGIDAIGRLANVAVAPPNGPVRVFARLEDYQAVFRIANGRYDTSDGGAVYAASAGILMMQNPENPTSERSLLVHERVHQRSVHQYNTTITRGDPPGVDANLVLGLNRYGEPKTLFNFTEAVTDMAMARIMFDADQEEIGAPHAPASVLLSGVMTETINKLDISPQELEFALYRGLFAVDDEAIGMIREALGPERTNMFLNLGNVELKHTELAAHMLGLKDTATYMKSLSADIDAGRPVWLDTYPWLFE